MSTNEITGDKLISKHTDGYAAGYDLIWKKDKPIDKDICNTRCSSATRKQHIASGCCWKVCSREKA